MQTRAQRAQFKGELSGSLREQCPLTMRELAQRSVRTRATPSHMGTPAHAHARAISMCCLIRNGAYSELPVSKESSVQTLEHTEFAPHPARALSKAIRTPSSFVWGGLQKLAVKVFASKRAKSLNQKEPFRFRKIGIFRYKFRLGWCRKSKYPLPPKGRGCQPHLGVVAKKCPDSPV